MDDSRWQVGKVDNFRGEIRWTLWDDTHEYLAAIANNNRSDVYHEANETIDFIVELVHEIERLQTENIALNDECDMLQDIANADSANYITPGNWGGYT